VLVKRYMPDPRRAATAQTVRAERQAAAMGS
jgi:hypothetical protein